MPLEKLCTKFGAFVHPTGFNIMLQIQNYAQKPDNE